MTILMGEGLKRGGNNGVHIHPKEDCFLSW